MNYEDLKKLVGSGKRPLVCFTKKVEMEDTQFEEGMLAEIVEISVDTTYSKDICEITFSEKNYQEYNKNLEKSIWYNPKNEKFDLKFSQVHKREIIASINDESEDIKSFVLKDGNMDIFKEYISSKTDLTYVEWLEENLSACRALLN